MTDGDTAPRADLLIENAGELLTLRGASPRVGPALRDLGLVRDGAVAMAGGGIIAAGAREEVLSRVALSPDATHLDVAGRVVMPGFVDPHTHVVFTEGRQAEYEARIKGASYEEIARRGGGIAASVRSVRAASRDDLVSRTRRHLDSMLAHGTTTAEAKSGYGLETAAELRQLEVIRALGDHPLTLVPTFLGAHAVPPEHDGNADGYVELLIGETLPEVARLGLATYCDAWPERGAFDLEQARRVLLRARELGLRLRLHADELSDFGAAGLAAELRADSADHLIHASRTGLEAMRAAGVVAALLPGTSWSLRLPAHAPARRMVEMGLAVALATDFNPGSSMCESMGMAIALACTELRLLPAEAIAAATVNAAHALRLGDRIGQLAPGYCADLLVLDTDDHRDLAYHYGVNHVRTVIKDGRVVVDQATVGGWVGRTEM